MQIASHAAEVCPSHEEKYRPISVNWYEKVESIAAKYGIKFLGSYTDPSMHDIYTIYDTPGMDVFMKLAMEPDMMAMWQFNKGRTFPVLDHKATLALVKK
ncbi:MAG TPA: hypothetical protein VGK23_01145 [Methanomassiliicoccales archaeon]